MHAQVLELDIGHATLCRSMNDELQGLTYAEGDTWWFLSLRKTLDYLYRNSEAYRDAVRVACERSGPRMHVNAAGGSVISCMYYKRGILA